MRWIKRIKNWWANRNRCPYKYPLSHLPYTKPIKLDDRQCCMLKKHEMENHVIKVQNEYHSVPDKSPNPSNVHIIRKP